MSLNFKIWLAEADTQPVNLTPQQNVVLSKTMGEELAANLAKVRPGAKINPKLVKAGTLKKVFTNPALKSLDPTAVEGGVDKIFKKIPGIVV